MQDLPKQRLSYKNKAKDNFAWAKQTLNVLIDNFSSTYGVVSSTSTNYHRMLSNYQLYNNELNQADFEKECNPLNIDIGAFKDTIQPYNKTYNKIQVLLSEELKRPFVFKVVLVNSEGIKSKVLYRDNLIKQYIQNQIQKSLSSVYGENPPEDAMDPNEVNKYMRTSYLEAREITASKILEYLWKKLDIDSLKNDSFKHGLISGYEFVYVGRENDEPYIEGLNPLGMFYHKSPEVKFIQDGLYAGYKTYMTTADILDRFGMYLSDEDKDRIDSRDNYSGNNLIGPTMKYPDHTVNDTVSRNIGSYGESSIRQSDMIVAHVEWKSYRKVGFLTSVNDYGDEEVTLVSEDFEVPSYATKETVVKSYGRKCVYTYFDGYSLYWDYIPEVWSGVRIGADIFCKIGPKEDQFRSLDNPYDVKLGYHGAAYSSMNASAVSLMDRMKPFQYLYFIIMHKLKKLIAQDNGKVYQFDRSMVDPKLGLEKTLYYIKELNIDIYNSLQNADQPGVNQRGKVTQATDMSNMQNIMGYVNLLAAIDQQISDVAGITRQREGQMSPNEAVGNSQSAIQMSSAVTEIYFHLHFNLWGKILTSLVQTAQSCYKEKSVVKQYVLNDLSLATLEITPDDLNNSDFGVFISSSIKDNDLFKSLQSLAADLIRSTRASFSDLISLYSATSAEELKNEILASEEKTNALNAQSQQQQLEAQAQVEQAKNDNLMEIAKLESETKIRVAEIGSFARLQDQDVDNDGLPDQLEIDKFKHQVKMDEEKLKLERTKINKKTT